MTDFDAISRIFLNFDSDARNSKFIIPQWMYHQMRDIPLPFIEALNSYYDNANNLYDISFSILKHRTRRYKYPIKNEAKSSTSYGVLGANAKTLKYLNIEMTEHTSVIQCKFQYFQTFQYSSAYNEYEKKINEKALLFSSRTPHYQNLNSGAR